MTDATKLIAGILLVTVPTIEYGGTFLLGLLSRSPAGFTDFQRSMFRAGHAHAGFSPPIGWAVRIGFAAAPVLISAGFFAAAMGEGRTRPGGLIVLLWIGVFVLASSVITLGIGLIRSRG